VPACRALRGHARVLRDPQLDAAFKDLVLTLPSELHRRAAGEVDPQRVHAVREAMRQLATALQADWAWAWDEHQRHRRLPPRRMSAPAAAPWPAWPWPCCAWPRAQRATRSGPARPTSASRTPAT
jgi:hypothetical protein